MKEAAVVTFQEELVTDEISAKEIVWDDLSVMDILDTLENRQDQPHDKYEDKKKAETPPLQQPIELKPAFSSLYFDAVEDDDDDDKESLSIPPNELKTSLSSSDSSVDSFQSSIAVEQNESSAPVKVLHFRSDDTSECSTLAPSVVSNMTTQYSPTTLAALEDPRPPAEEESASAVDSKVKTEPPQTVKDDSLEIGITEEIPKSATKDDLLCAIKALGEKLIERTENTAKPLEPEGQVMARSSNNSIEPKETQSVIENCSEFREPAPKANNVTLEVKGPCVIETLPESLGEKEVPFDELNSIENPSQSPGEKDMWSEVVPPEDIKRELLPEIANPPIDIKDEASVDLYSLIEAADSMGDNSLLVLPTVPKEGVCGDSTNAWAYFCEKTGGATCSIPLHSSVQELLGKGEDGALKLIDQLTTAKICGENPSLDTLKFLFDPDQYGPILPSNVPWASEAKVQEEKDEAQAREEMIHKAFQNPSTMAKLRLGKRSELIGRRKWGNGAGAVSARSRRAPKDTSNKHVYDDMKHAMSVRLQGAGKSAPEMGNAPEQTYAEEESSIVGLYEVHRTSYPSKVLPEKDLENLKTYQIIQSEILERERAPEVLTGAAILQVQSPVSSESGKSVIDHACKPTQSTVNTAVHNDTSVELVMKSSQSESLTEWKVLLQSGTSIHERAIKLKAMCMKEIECVLRDAPRCLKEEGFLVERIKPPEYEEFGYEAKTESEMVVERVLEWIDCEEPEIQSKYIPSPLTEANRSRAMLQTIPWRQELLMNGIVLLQANVRRFRAQKECEKLRHAKYFFRQHWRDALRRSTERTRELRLLKDGKLNHAAVAQQSFLAHRDKRARLWHAIEKHRHWRYMNKILFDELYCRVDEREEVRQNIATVLEQIHKRLDFLVAHSEQKCFMFKGGFKFFPPVETPDPQLRAKKDACFKELLPNARQRMQSHINKRQLLQQFQKFLYEQEMQLQQQEREKQLAYKLVQGFQDFMGNFQFGADTKIVESAITIAVESKATNTDMPTIPLSEQ